MKHSAYSVIKLLSAVTNVLGGWGIYIPHPIGINVCGKIKLFLQTINNYNCKLFTADDRTTEILQELTIRSVDPMVFYYDGSHKAYTRLTKILNAAKAGVYNGRNIKRLPIVIFDNPITDELLNEMFFIELDELIETKLDIWDVLPNPEMFPLVQDKIENLPTELSEDAIFIKSGTCFLYPFFKEMQKIDEYDLFQQYVDHLIELNEQSKDGYGLTIQFIKALYDYRNNGRKIALVELPNVHSEVSDKTEYFMFHDGRYMYMSNKLFAKITASFKKIIGPNRLKEILVEDEVLVKGSGKTYTSKMPYYNQYGELKRPDFLRFDMEKLQRPGELDFITYYGG